MDVTAKLSGVTAANCEPHGRAGVDAAAGEPIEPTSVTLKDSVVLSSSVR